MTMNGARLTSLLALLFAVSCSESRTPVSPTSTPTPTPTPTPPIARSVSGTWTGTYTPVCPNSPNCASVVMAPSPTQPFALVLRQEGQMITGQINLSGWMPRVATVSGTIDDSGAMTLQGGDSWPAGDFCTPAGGWRMTGWNGRFDARNGSIAGDFTFVTQKRISSCYYEQSLLVNATAMSMRPGGILDTTVSGHWQGLYAIRKCTPVGWNICTPFADADDVTLNLDLTQSGSQLTGTIVGVPFSNLAPLPVTGTANGSTVNLSGSRSEDVSSARHTIRLTSWSVTIDAVGRMQGGFSYIDEVVWTSGSNAGMTWSTSYDADLKYVVRVPW